MHRVNHKSKSADACELPSTSPDHEYQLLLCNVHGLPDKVCFSNWYELSASQGSSKQPLVLAAHRRHLYSTHLLDLYWIKQETVWT